MTRLYYKSILLVALWHAAAMNRQFKSIYMPGEIELNISSLEKYANFCQHVLNPLLKVLTYRFLLYFSCSRYKNATPNLCWVSCAINKGGFFEIAFSSPSTHICLALRHLLTFCLTLMR